MSGALYCTGYLEELEEFFEPDSEVIVYRDGNEMLDKVRFYLSHPAEANAIRAAGLRRAQADHTYQQRFRQLFTTLGLA
jgi:spore maturation protein CgeB